MRKLRGILGMVALYAVATMPEILVWGLLCVVAGGFLGYLIDVVERAFLGTANFHILFVRLIRWIEKENDEPPA